MAGMAIAGKILSIVSTLATTANNYQNLQQQIKANEINENIATNNANNVLVQGNYAKDVKLLEGKKYIANQYVKNLQSGAGGAGTTGEKAVVKSVNNLENDLNLLSYNYHTKAVDFLNQAKMFNYESKVAKANAANLLIAGGLNVVNSLIPQQTDLNNTTKTMDSKFFNGLAKPMYARNSKLFL